MTAGDHIFHQKITRSIGTTDGTATAICTVAVPIGTEGVVTIKGEAFGKEYDGSLHKYYERLVGHGTVDASSFGMQSSSSMEVDDPDTSGWGGVTLVENGDSIELTVDGDAATNIRWEGTLEVSVREQPISGG